MFWVLLRFYKVLLCTLAHSSKRKLKHEDFLVQPRVILLATATVKVWPKNCRCSAVDIFSLIIMMTWWQNSSWDYCVMFIITYPWSQKNFGNPSISNSNRNCVRHCGCDTGIGAAVPIKLHVTMCIELDFKSINLCIPINLNKTV